MASVRPICRVRNELSGERAGAATAGKEHDLQALRLRGLTVARGIGHLEIMPRRGRPTRPRFALRPANRISYSRSRAPAIIDVSVCGSVRRSLQSRPFVLIATALPVSSERSTRNSLVPLRVAGLLLTFSVAGLAWVLGDGPAGLGYSASTDCCSLPGLPIGFLLFGRRHAAGWIAGALIGYGLSALVLWVPADLALHVARLAAGRWARDIGRDVHVLSLGAAGSSQLPAWHRTDTVALLCTLLVVPLLVAGPFSPRRRAGPSGQPAVSRLLHRRLSLARRADGGAGESRPADSQPVSRAARAELLLGLLRAAGDDRPPRRGRAFARGLSPAQRALCRAAVRRLHLPLRMVRRSRAPARLRSQSS